MSENPPPPLTPQQIKAARMLAKGESTHWIAARLKICDDTLYRWKKKKAFREMVEKTIADELAETRFRMAHIVDRSISALWHMVEGCNNDHTRLQAILHVLKLAGVAHIPSPNVTQTAQWVIKHEDQEEPEELEEPIVTKGYEEKLLEKKESLEPIEESIEELPELPEEEITEW